MEITKQNQRNKFIVSACIFLIAAFVTGFFLGWGTDLGQLLTGLSSTTMLVSGVIFLFGVKKFTSKNQSEELALPPENNFAENKS